MEIIKERTMEVWKESLNYILENGIVFEDENKMKCREVMNLSTRIEKPDDAGKLIEVLNEFKKWVYPPQSEIAATILTKKESPAYGYCYGARIFSWANAIDQVNGFVLPLLKNNKSSRRAVITLLDPKTDSKPENRQIPGLVVLDFKIRGDRLNVTAVVRSNDIFIGWPANIYQMRVLQKYIGEKLGVEPGYIATFSTSAHIFEEYREEIERVVGVNRT